MTSVTGAEKNGLIPQICYKTTVLQKYTQILPSRQRCHALIRCIMSLTMPILIAEFSTKPFFMTFKRA